MPKTKTSKQQDVAHALPTLLYPGTGTPTLQNEENQRWLEKSFSGIIRLYSGNYNSLGFHKHHKFHQQLEDNGKTRTENAKHLLTLKLQPNKNIMLLKVCGHEISTQSWDTQFRNALHRQQTDLEQTIFGRRYGRRSRTTDTGNPIPNWFSNNEQEVGLDNAEIFTPIKLSATKKITNSEGEDLTIYSEFPEHVINNFGGAIDLTGLDFNLTLNLKSEITNRESDYARNSKFTQFKNPKVSIDSISSFSCFGDKLPAENFLQAVGNNKPIKVLHLENLYRGGEMGLVDPKITSVRPVKVTKGGYAFPYLTKREVLCQKTLTLKKEIFFCIGIFDDLKKIIKYKRSRAFLPELLIDLCEHEGLKIFNREEYLKKVQEEYGSYTKYWNGISSLFQKKLPQAAKPIDSKNSRGKANFAKVKDKDIGYLLKCDQLSIDPAAITYKKISKTHIKMKEKIDAKKSENRRQERNIRILNDKIARMQSDLAAATSQVEKVNTVIIKGKEDYNRYVESSIALETKYKKAKKIYTKFIDDYDFSISNQSENYLKNLEKTGIIIDDIVFIKNGQSVSITDNPSIAYKAKVKNDNEDIQLHSVHFHTTKPVIIRVDAGAKGDKCKKVVGGPYIVRVEQTVINIGLAGSDSCFGKKNTVNRINAWIHPHTSAASLGSLPVSWDRFKRFIESSQDGCLGEASPLLYNAFKENDPKTAIFAAMTWITSANSADAWGRSWKEFPTVSEVNLDGQNGTPAVEKSEEDIMENMITTEEGMETIAETIATNIAELPAQAEEHLPTNHADEANFLDEVIEEIVDGLDLPPQTAVQELRDLGTGPDPTDLTTLHGPYTALQVQRHRDAVTRAINEGIQPPEPLDPNRMPLRFSGYTPYYQR
jgi:hypothetical protein